MRRLLAAAEALCCTSHAGSTDCPDELHLGDDKDLAIIPGYAQGNICRMNDRARGKTLIQLLPS